MKVLFVGLSNKLNVEPFDSSTNSGKVVDLIIEKIDSEYYKTNLVNFAPLNSNGKLRYPTKTELSDAIPSFINNVQLLQPDVIIAFGNIVSSELRKMIFPNIKIFYQKHPSYMYIYKRKFLDQYINEIVSQII